MKKLITIIAFVMIAAMSFAQTTVTTPSKDIKLQLRGIRQLGDDVELTLLVTNLSNAEAVVNLVGGIYQNGAGGSVAYDNDGNVYELSRVLVSVANKTLTDQYSATAFPPQVPVKCHLLIKNVAPEATAFTRINICVLCPQLSLNNIGARFEINNVSFK